MNSRFSLQTTHFLPGPPQARRAQLSDPATWAANWPGCRLVQPLTDGHTLVRFDLPDAPAAGYLVGRLTATPGPNPDCYDLTLAMSGPAGSVAGIGTAALVEREGGLAVQVSVHGVVDGRLATVSPRLLETIGRSLLRRALAPLAGESPAPSPPTRRQAWPAPAGSVAPRLSPGWILGGGVLAFLFWRARRQRR